MPIGTLNCSQRAPPASRLVHTSWYVRWASKLLNFTCPPPKGIFDSAASDQEHQEDEWEVQAQASADDWSGEGSAGQEGQALAMSG